jgi:hypothetical protein
MIIPAPGCSLIIRDNCPYLGQSVCGVCPVRLCCSLGVDSVFCHKNVIIGPALPGIQGDLQSDCRENGLEQRQIQKWRQGCQDFLLLFINSWAQVRGQCFSAKAVKGPVTISWPAAATPEHTLVPSLCKDAGCYFSLLVEWCGGKCRITSIREAARFAGKGFDFGGKDTSFAMI